MKMSDALQKALDACSTEEDRDDLRSAYIQIMAGRRYMKPLAENVMIDMARTIAAQNKLRKEQHRWVDGILLAGDRKETKT